MHALADMFTNKGEYDRALPLYEECLAKSKRVLGEDHPNTLESLNNLAFIFYSKGEYDRALPLFEECLAKRKRVLGDDHPDTLESLNLVYPKVSEQARHALAEAHRQLLSETELKPRCGPAAG